jgi:hypothetical protein
MEVQSREAKRAEYTPLVGDTWAMHGVWVAVSGLDIQPTKKGWKLNIGWFQECRDRKTKPVFHHYATERESLDQLPSIQYLRELITGSLDKAISRKWMKAPE